MAAAKKIRYALDEDQHAASWETGADAAYEEALSADVDEVADQDYEVGADAEYEDTGQLDYEQVADPEYDEPVLVEPEAVAQEEARLRPPAAARPPAGGFAYALGRAVLPLTQHQAHPVVWRGYLKERHPATGLVQRVPVYRLGDGYWDCYREEELRAA